MFETFIDQWKSGGNAELEFFCERGQLRVTLCADVGPWRAPSGELWPKPWDFGGSPKQSPSRVRRRERRASERRRSAAEVAAAEKAAAKVAAAEVAAAEKAAVEVPAKEAAEKEAAEKEAAAESASTSCCGSKQQALSCWSCDKLFTVDDQGYIPEHQCAKPSPVGPGPSAPMVFKKPVRMLDGSPVWSPRRK